ncbi:MAG: hypothetical protein ACE5HJ_01835 [Thermoplasmata archaeon]
MTTMEGNGERRIENEGEDLQTKLLVSYDVARARTRTRGKVHRKVFGSESRKAVNGRVKTYRYEGLISRPGVDYVGQSVLLMPETLGKELLRFLRHLEVPCHGRMVFIPRKA